MHSALSTHIYLTFAGYGPSEKSVLPNQPLYSQSYKPFSLSCSGKLSMLQIPAKFSARFQHFSNCDKKEEHLPFPPPNAHIQH